MGCFRIDASSLIGLIMIYVHKTRFWYLTSTPSLLKGINPVR